MAEEWGDRRSVLAHSLPPGEDSVQHYSIAPDPLLVEWRMRIGAIADVGHTLSQYPQ